LATAETYVAQQIAGERSRAASVPVGLAVVSVLTAAALFVGGYHPYAEDGGVYLPGVIKLLHPDLYPTWTSFVTAQSRFSLFAPIMAAVVRVTGLGLMACVFFAYLATMWTTLYAAWMILSRCFDRFDARLAGVSVLALCLTMPIAGTSLILLDPYITARSFSTPCSLLAIAGTLDVISDFKSSRRARWKSIALVGLSLLAAALMHPLMAAYAAGCLALLACSSIGFQHIRFIAIGSVALVSIAVAIALYALAPTQPDGYIQVAQTRDYWFLSNWHWYEILGLFAPLLVLAAILRDRLEITEPALWLARMAIAAGIIGSVVTVIFARKSAPTYIVAMLQPLRVYLLVYVVMILLAAAELGKRLLLSIRWRWSLLYLLLGSLLFVVQLSTFPHSNHVEFPGSAPRNDWQKGFLWIRNNTPKDALFAIGTNYIRSKAEDSQNFRPIAERSALPDFTKDGGIAAIEPELTAQWIYGQTIQAGLSSATDDERRSKLAQARIEWLVLPSSAATGFSCPYQNHSMKVCFVPLPKSQRAALLSADAALNFYAQYIQASR
jgi:hypothetical protein